MDDNRGNEANASGITKWGVILSAVYLVAMAIYVIAEWGNLLEMAPNEFGDFLAGAFGPLALGWLVCGYFQQGIELRQNTQALSLQVEELRNSVEQQAALARANQQMLEHERELAAESSRQKKMSEAPIFAIRGWEPYGTQADFYGVLKLQNTGAKVWKDLSIGGAVEDGWEVDDIIASEAYFNLYPVRERGLKDDCFSVKLGCRTISGAVYVLTVFFNVEESGLAAHPSLMLEEQP